MPQKKNYQVYLLVNRMNRRFVGKAENAETEFVRHNKGDFKGTKPFKPWKMEWCSEPLSRNDALRLKENLRHHKTNPSMLDKIIQDHRMGK